jgi:hypothetical protein
VGRLRLPRPRSSIPHAHLQRMSTKKIDLVVMNIDILAFASLLLFSLRRIFQQLSFKFRLVPLPVRSVSKVEIALLLKSLVKRKNNNLFSNASSIIIKK